jgi:hypothetical protein
MKTAGHSSSCILLTGPYSRVFVNHIERTGRLALVLGATAVLAAGCSSTDTGFSARLISPVPNSQEATNFEDDVWYAPSRSVAFDPELFGS